MTANFGLAPRDEGCWVCRHVTHPEDVTVRLIGSEGQKLPTADAIDYLLSIGLTGTSREWSTRFKKHREHVTRFIVPGSVIAPVHRVGVPAPTAPVGGAPSWIRAPDRAIDLGLDAMGTLAAQLDSLEPAELIALARLGVSAAAKMGDWHAKGRQFDQMDDLMKATFDANHTRDN